MQSVRTSSQNPSRGTALAALIAAIAVGLVWCAPLEATADEGDAEQRAMELFHQGADHFYEEDYERALDKFRKAYDTHPHPMIVYNMSLTHMRLGDVESAWDYALEARRMGGLPEAESTRNDGRLHGTRTVIDARAISDAIERQTPDDPPDDVADVVDAPPEPEPTGISTVVGISGVATAVVGTALLSFAGVTNHRLGQQIEAYERAAEVGDRQAVEILRNDIEQGTRRGTIALISGASLTALGLTGVAIWRLGLLESSTPAASLTPSIGPGSDGSVEATIRLTGQF